MITSVCDHFDCEMSILTNGDILVKAKPPGLSDVGHVLEKLAKSPQEVKWWERSKLMTENGLMEQGGNLIWFCLAIRDDGVADGVAQSRIASILTRYEATNLQKPSGPQPYAGKLSNDDRDRACSLRNKLFIAIMQQLKAEIFPLMDELESTLARSKIRVPCRDYTAVRCCSFGDGVADVSIRTVGAHHLSFRALGGEWRLDGTKFLSSRQ